METILQVSCLIVIFVAGSFTGVLLARRSRHFRRIISPDNEETPEQKEAWELDDRRSLIRRSAFQLLEGGIWADSPVQYSTRERIAWLVEQAIELEIQIDRKVNYAPLYKDKFI